MRSVLFELSEGASIKYANGKGDEIEVSHIELREPTGKHSHIVCAIESAIQAGVLSMSNLIGKEQIEEAQKEARNNQGKQDDKKLDEDAVMSMLFSGGIDTEKLVLRFRELFKQVAFMGGEKPITEARMDEMTHKDFRAMMGKYAANFIMN